MILRRKIILYFIFWKLSILFSYYKFWKIHTLTKHYKYCKKYWSIFGGEEAFVTSAFVVRYLDIFKIFRFVNLKVSWTKNIFKSVHPQLWQKSWIHLWPHPSISPSPKPPFIPFSPSLKHAREGVWQFYQTRFIWLNTCWILNCLNYSELNTNSLEGHKLYL